MLPMMAIGAFVGVRSTEIGRLYREDIPPPEIQTTMRKTTHSCSTLPPIGESAPPTTSPPTAFVCNRVSRSTSVLGNKKEQIPLSTLKELAQEHGINHPMSIIQQVSEAIKKWGDFARAAGISKNIVSRYGDRMNLIHPKELH